MITFKEFCEAFKGQRIRPQKDKSTVADHADVKDYKKGDIINCLQPDNSTWLPGKIKRFGQNMVHVIHNDGSEAGYRPEHIGIRHEYGPNKGKKVFGE
jgi:hypothetical protein